MNTGVHRVFTAEKRPRPALFLLLCLAVGLESVGAAAIFPLLAQIQATHHLATYSLGLMSGGYYLASLVAMLAFGRLLDGHKARPILLAGMGLGAASMIWFAFASDLWQLVGARSFGGLCAGVTLPTALKEARVAANSEERGTRIGRLNAAQTGGFVIGPFVGSLLTSVGGLSLPFLLVAAALTMAALGILATPKRIHASGTNGPVAKVVAPQMSLTAAQVRVAAPAVAAVVALTLLAIGAQLSFGMYNALWSRLLTDRGASTFLIGLSLSLYGIPVVLASPAGGRFAARRGPWVVTGVALTITALFMASYGLLTSATIIIVVGLADGFVQAVAAPGAYATVAEVYPQELAATGQARFGAAGTAAAGVSSVVAAPLYASLGAGFVFCGAALLTVAFVTAAVLVGRGSNRRRKTPISQVVNSRATSL